MDNDYLLERLRYNEINETHLRLATALFYDIEPRVKSFITGQHLGIYQCGASAKGTATLSSSFIDKVLFYPANYIYPVDKAYVLLIRYLQSSLSGLKFERKGVAINISSSSAMVDIIPAKLTSDKDIETARHSLYNTRINRRVDTNLIFQTLEVKRHVRTDEIKLLKIWRDKHRLNFPSFYLERTIIDVLGDNYDSTLAHNYCLILEFLSNSFASTEVRDFPPYDSNIISQELDIPARNTIATQAKLSLQNLSDPMINI